MKLLNRIQNILSVKRQSKNKGIASIGTFISLPTREELEHYPEKLEKLETYKSEYWKKLLEKKNFISSSVEIESLQSKMKMYVDLIGNIINSSDEYADSFEKVMYYENGTKRLNHKTKMAKLMLYRHDIEQLEFDTLLRIVALKEIFEGKKFLTPQRRRSIREEINNLCYTALIFINSKRAILAELTGYTAEYGILDDEEFVDEEIEKKLVNDKREELIDMLEVLELIPIDEAKKFSSLELATYERILEEYFYTNDIREKLKRDIYELGLMVDEDEPENKDEIRSMIFKIETCLKALALYGQDQITKGMIEKFYSVKFDAIEYHNFPAMQEVLENANYFEVECYQNIIAKKIEQILLDKNEVVKKLIYDETPRKEFIAAFARHLKNSYGEYSYWDILNDKRKLDLILAFDRKEGFDNYLHQSNVSTVEYSDKIDFHGNILTFKTEIPLATVYEMMVYNESVDGVCDALGEMYLIWKTYNSNTPYFHLPEGLIDICVTNLEGRSEKDQLFVAKIRELARDRIVLTPDSLRTIKGPLFEGGRYSEIRFNDGLKELSGRVLVGADIMEKLVLPSSLVSMYGSVLEGTLVDRIVIKGSDIDTFFEERDWTNNQLLRAIIRKVFKVRHTGKVEPHFISEKIRRNQRIYGRRSTLHNMDLFDHDSTLYEMEAQTVVDYLCFETDEDHVCLSSIELTPKPYEIDSDTVRRNTGRPLLSKEWRKPKASCESLIIAYHIRDSFQKKRMELKEKNDHDRLDRGWKKH